MMLRSAKVPPTLPPRLSDLHGRERLNALRARAKAEREQRQRRGFGIARSGVLRSLLNSLFTA